MSQAIAEARLRKQRQEQARRKLFVNGSRETVVDGNRWHLLQHAIDHIGSETHVNVLEFGVAKGKSMALFARKFTDAKCQFFGFDSFEGLPEDWTPGPMIAKGAFSTGGTAPDINDNRVRFIKGWFQDTVQQFFQACYFRPPVLVHFDADLYSSTLFLLVTLWYSLPEYFFIFDDFAFDECVALHDFSTAFPVEIEWLAKRVNETGTPVQAFGRLRRKAFLVG